MGGGGRKAHPPKRDWYWELNDPLGVWRGLDWNAVRRGRQVYTEVFAPCHPLTQLTFNHFQAFMTREEIKKLASSYEIMETTPDKEGNLALRAGKPTDWLPAPYPNQRAAQFANNGAAPPDLRTILFGREGGADYVFALLTGYGWSGTLMPVPPWLHLKTGQYFNPYFKGGVISMPPPLSDGMIEYEDGTPATVSQMSKDVVNFLRWTLEPEYDERRMLFWKCFTTSGLITMLMFHCFQKAYGWRIYQRLRYRYWKKE